MSLFLLNLFILLVIQYDLTKQLYNAGHSVRYWDIEFIKNWSLTLKKTHI